MAHTENLLQIMFNVNSGPLDLGEYFNPQEITVRRVWQQHLVHRIYFETAGSTFFCPAKVCLRHGYLYNSTFNSGN